MAKYKWENERFIEKMKEWDMMREWQMSFSELFEMIEKLSSYRPKYGLNL